MFECDASVSVYIQANENRKCMFTKKQTNNSNKKNNDLKKLQNILYANKTKGNNDGEMNTRKKGDTYVVELECICMCGQACSRKIKYCEKNCGKLVFRF